MKSCASVLLACGLFALLPACAADKKMAVEVDAFPELLSHPPAKDDGEIVYGTCAQIKAKRVSELPVPWRDAIARIDLTCKDLSGEESGYGEATASTEVVAILKPGAITFATLPVVEIRMKDSELWGDHQFIIDLPFAQARPALKRYMQATCGLSEDALRNAPETDCTVEPAPGRSADSLYAPTGEISSIWAHADESDPRRTVYADAWSD